jgi:6-phosphogluconolactonase/glucosamine-6-phosphate isomerase/deaminase
MILINSIDNVVQTVNPQNLQQRITLNFNRLLKSDHTLLLLSGQNKKQVFEQLNSKSELPINWVMQNSKNAWVLTDFNLS